MTGGGGLVTAAPGTNPYVLYVGLPTLLANLCKKMVQNFAAKWLRKIAKNF